MEEQPPDQQRKGTPDMNSDNTKPTAKASEKTCATCPFFHRKQKAGEPYPHAPNQTAKNGYGECRINPPALAYNGEDKYCSAEFPIVKDFHWCGQHPARQIADSVLGQEIKILYDEDAFKVKQSFKGGPSK